MGPNALADVNHSYMPWAYPLAQLNQNMYDNTWFGIRVFLLLDQPSYQARSTGASYIGNRIQIEYIVDDYFTNIPCNLIALRKTIPQQIRILISI